MFFDSHAHYDDGRFDADRAELLNSFKQNGIDYVVNIGTNLETAQNAWNWAKNTILFTARSGFIPRTSERFRRTIF